MFKNRALQVRVVKTSTATPEPQVSLDTPFEKKVAIIANVAQKVLKQAAIAGAAYIILDTFRQVAIIDATNHPIK